MAGASFVVLLAECSRIPVDDPTTHLELTMIHEVMVLDHGGVDLAFIEYGAAREAVGASRGSPWRCCSSGPPRERRRVGSRRAAPPWRAWSAAAAAVGVVESVMARLRLSRVPQLLVAALAMSALALALVFVRH